MMFEAQRHSLAYGPHHLFEMRLLDGAQRCLDGTHAAADVVTSHTVEGVAALREHLVNVLGQRTTEGPVVQQTAARCVDSLEKATQSVQRAWQLCGQQWVEELIAVELRTALNQLGLIIGAVYTDDILDRIFSTFCIGK